jgi:replicative DNA helicase
MRNTRAFEECVIGSAMLDGSVIAQCNVKPGDFELQQHRFAWDAIQRLHARRESTDALTVTELLDHEQAIPPRDGWLAYLAMLCRNTASTQTAPSHAAKLREYSALRQAQAIGKTLSASDSVDGIDAVIRSLMELTKGTRDHSCHLLDAMQDAMDLMDDDTSHVSTGLKDLDSCTGGLHDEDLIVIGARPAMGKTAIMLNLALSSTVPVGVISGEQGRGQIGMRAMAIDGEVSLHRMRTHTLQDSDWARISTAMTLAKQKQIWINDKPAPNIDDVVRQARVWKHERDIGVLMIDYLQKLRGGGGADMRLQIGDVVSRLKDLARELKIPVVVLAQVKREVESRPLGADGMGRMPFAADMGESGIIEQEADHIYTLYRPEVYSDLPQIKGVAYVNICKNRHGPIGHKKIAWRGEYLQFGDLAATEYGDQWQAA